MTCLSHDDAIRVEYPSVADLLDAFAEVIEAGAFERAAEGRIVLADEAERGARAARIHAAALHPALAGTSEITNDPSGWPDHWLRSADLDRSTQHDGASCRDVASSSLSASSPPVGRSAS